MHANCAVGESELIDEILTRIFLCLGTVRNLDQHQWRQCHANAPQLTLDESMHRRAFTQCKVLEVDQLGGIAVACEETHDPHATLEQTRIDRIETAYRGPIRRLTDAVAGCALERQRIRIARRRRHHQGVIGLQHLAEEGARLRCLVKTMMGFVDDAADAHAIGTRLLDQRVQRLSVITLAARTPALCVACCDRAPGRDEHAAGIDSAKPAIAVEIEQAREDYKAGKLTQEKLTDLTIKNQEAIETARKAYEDTRAKMSELQKQGVPPWQTIWEGGLGQIAISLAGAWLLAKQGDKSAVRDAVAKVEEIRGPINARKGSAPTPRVS